MVSREMIGFLVHQVISTLGVMTLSAMSWYGTVELLKLVRLNVTVQVITFVLLGIPAFRFKAQPDSS